MNAGMEVVLSSLQENYVRPDEANAAQSKVATKSAALREEPQSGRRRPDVASVVGSI